MKGGDRDDTGLGPARAVFLVARRELTTRVRGKVFVIGTIVSVALLAVYAVLQITVFDRIKSTPTFHLAVTATTEPLAAPIRAAARAQGASLLISTAPSRAAAERELRAGTLDALLTGTAAAPRMVVKSQPASTLHALLVSVARQEALAAELRDAGLDPAAVIARAARVAVPVDVLQPLKPGALQAPIIGALLAFALYIFLGIYGSVIAQGVVAEKASRVIEVLLSTLRPGQLLLGKVLGVGSAGLLQFGIIIACGLALTLPTGILTLPGAAIGGALAGIVWFVLGFVLYALMLAATASLVSRVEEVSAATIPVTMLLVVAWLLAYVVFIPEISSATAGSTPAAGVTNLGTVASLIPFFTPILMPIRIAAGVVPAWQVALALLLTLLSVAGIAWIGARVYANSVLHFGVRLRLWEALRRSR